MARKSIVFGCLLLLLPIFAGCGDIMENPTDDPHPPSVANLVLSPGTIRVGDSVNVTFSYADAGGDIIIAHLQDRNSGTEYLLEITEDSTTGRTINPFPGTSGVARGVIEKFEGSQQGPHSVYIWLEDAEGSVSGFAEATINVVL
jgi:hypothetical protein